MLEDELRQILEPLVRELVRDEVERAKLRWRWQSVRQAAETLDLSVDAVHQRVSRGKLPHRKLDGRVYIDMDALDRQLERLR